MQIKIFKDEDKLVKFFFKILRKDIKKNPYARIGIDGEGLSFLFESLVNFKKIDWNFVRIFSPVEYFDSSTNSPTSFSEILKNKLAKNLNNFNLDNFEYITEKINFLKSKNAINGLYKYKDSLDILVFYLDYRGNFLRNDYESKITFLNFSTNGSKIVSPGIKSILLAKKIVFICKDDNEKTKETIKNFVSKKIIENDLYTFLNFHENFYFLTLKKLINKSDIALSVSNQDYSLWHDILLSSDLDEIDDSHNEENKNLNSIPLINNPNDDNNKTYTERNDTINLNSLDEELNQALLENENKLTNEDNNLFEESNFIEEDNNLLDGNNFEKDDESETSKEPEISSIIQIDNNLTEDKQEKNEGFSLGIIDDIKKIISEEKKLDENIFLDSKIEENDENNEKDNDWKEDISFDVNYKDDLNIDNEDLFKEVDQEIDIKNNTNNFIANKNDEENSFFKYKQEKLENLFFKNDPTIKETLKKEDIVVPIKHDKPVNNDNLTSNFINIKGDINKEIVSLNDVHKIKKIIEIKQNTLKDIEKIMWEINNNKISIENFLVNKPNGEKLFKYCPGHRPCPLLAVFDTPNQKQYEEIILDMKVVFSYNVNFKPFDNSLKHLWNHSSYISYNEQTLEINLIAFIDFSYLIFLLRYLNKDLWFKISGALLEILEKNLKEYNKEFLLLEPKNTK